MVDMEVEMMARRMRELRSPMMRELRGLTGEWESTIHVGFRMTRLLLSPGLLTLGKEAVL